MQAILLTGGESRRMGTDKASLMVGGVPLAVKIARALAEAGAEVTVLGREPIDGYRFQPDETPHSGPLVALASFRPAEEFVFVSSCDLPLFTSSVVSTLRGEIRDYDAAVPLLEERLQPLCALYRASSLLVASQMVAAGETRIMRWLDRLNIRTVPELVGARNVNTPDELAQVFEKLGS
jgi:molybdopterin-guanine dinucleotide biosynthesis protein A